MTSQLMGGGLDRLVRPRSVAIVGASADPTRTAGRPARYLRKHGFAGSVFLVNPRVPSIDGLICYPSVAALPQTPDVGLVLLGRERATEAVRELAARGTGAAIVLAGGYAEVDATGAAYQAELRAAAGPMRLLGPNTIGLVNVPDATALSASAALEIPTLPLGGVSVVAQSGGILSALLSRGAAHGVGFSRLVSTGNEADVDVSEVIEYLLDDPPTAAIALYIESVRRPDRFRAAAEAAARRGAPLVVFKVGRSPAGAQSATSHTGAMAGLDRLYDALFEQTGAIRVTTFGELIDVAGALAARGQRRLAGRRLAILTSTGGGGALVADACGLHGFQVPPPDPATVAHLQQLLVGEAAVADRNPVDLTLAGLQDEVYRQAIAALLASSDYDALVVVVGASGLSQPDLAADSVLAAAPATGKPVLVYVNPHAPNIVARLNQAGVPAFDTPEGCAAALAALWRTSPARLQLHPPAATFLRRVSLEAPSGRLDEVASKALFARYGIPAVKERAVDSAEAAVAAAREIGGLVVVKVRGVAHKSDVGGVRLGLRPEEVAICCQQMPSPDGWVVQEQVSQGVEMLLGLVRDPQLGPALMLGAGGTATEVFEDTALRLLPLQPGDSESMLDSLRVRALLAGFRGRPRADVPALLAAVDALAALAADLGDRLLEAEINPLFVLPEGQGVRAADGLIVLR